MLIPGTNNNISVSNCESDRRDIPSNYWADGRISFTMSSTVGIDDQCRCTEAVR